MKSDWLITQKTQKTWFLPAVLETLYIDFLWGLSILGGKNQVFWVFWVMLIFFSPSIPSSSLDIYIGFVLFF